MEGWQLALVFKPFVLLAYLSAIAFFVFCLQKVFPNGPLKDVLFDRTYRDRHPVQFTFWVFGLYISMFIAIFTLWPETLG